VAQDDLTHTAVHWDTTSHEMGDMDFNDYANMVLGGDGAPDSEYMAMFNVPDPSTMVYFIVHAIVLGEDFYAEMEYTVDVLAKPVLSNVDFKDKVNAGEKVTVTFTISGVAIDRISHVGVHWDTTSHGEPLDFPSYANAETVDPSADGTYDVEFTVPDKAGNVYFVVHAIVDDIDYYAEDTEHMVTVEEKSDEDGLSTTTYIIIALVVIIFIAILAFAMMNRGDSED
ncbi:MAG: hypothetical protein KAQ96_08915, partial [Thermoplasmata archaeon]|nr:hypothetical protein [Thermoplasmata archaeon]